MRTAALSQRWLKITFQVLDMAAKHIVIYFYLFVLVSKIIVLCQTKRASPAGGSSNIAHKRIQGGVQADISLRVKSNFTWNLLTLTLHRCKSKKRLPFRVEIDHLSKQWSKDCDACIVRSWEHKRYTSVRAQFCKEYYGQQLQFSARVASLIAKTRTPIVTTRSYRGMPRSFPPSAPRKLVYSQYTPCTKKNQCCDLLYVLL